MSCTHRFPECSRTDAVLARHLDGDLGERSGEDRDASDGYAFVSADRLHEHLRECAICQTALRRARRLDASLANAAGAELAAHAQRHGASLAVLEQRWFAGVTAALASTAAPRTAATLARPAHTSVLPLLLLAACLVVLATLRGGAATEAPSIDGLRDSLAADATGPAVPMQSVTLPADALQRWRRRQNSADPDQSASLPLHELRRRLVDDQLDSRERLHTARQLLTAAAPLAGQNRSALAALVEALAAHGDQTPALQQLHGELLDLVRAAPHACGAMLSHLHALAVPRQVIGRSELAFVVVSARLGTPGLDAALRRLVRRHHDLAPLIASALRGAERARPAALLLNLWHDLAALGAIADDERTAVAWFVGQPASMFADLMAELRDCADAPRRRRCLLALGCADDARPLPTLLGWLDSPHFDDAHTAAFAIGCLPRHVLLTLLEAAGKPEAFLLRAALLRADLPAARRWLPSHSQPDGGLCGASLAHFLVDAATLRDTSAFTD